MKPFDTSRLVHLGQRKRIYGNDRRRVLWLWAAFAGGLLVLAWFVYRLGWAL